MPKFIDMSADVTIDISALFSQQLKKQTEANMPDSKPGDEALAEDSAVRKEEKKDGVV